MENEEVEGLMEVHSDLLRPSCLLHGFFDGEHCPVCEVLIPDNIELGLN